jgi:hypothetical protein
MFTAPGLAIKRANGEVLKNKMPSLLFFNNLSLYYYRKIVTPYYFAYEDLKEDWGAVKDKKPNVPIEPKVN